MPLTRSKTEAADSSYRRTPAPTAKKESPKQPKSKRETVKPARKPSVELEEAITVGSDAPPARKRQRHDEAYQMVKGTSPDPLTESPSRNGTTANNNTASRHPAKEKDPLEQQNQHQQPASYEVVQKIKKLIDTYGTLPSESLKLTDPLAPTPSNLLALLINAMLSSTRISHRIAQRTLNLLLENNYHDISTLRSTTWDQRTRVLTEGGYTHYRERTATHLGNLAEYILDNLGGDLNTTVDDSDKTESEKDNDDGGRRALESVRRSLGAIKGIGNIGIDIFCDSAQACWPSISPFIDPRSLASLEKMGIIVAGAGAKGLGVWDGKHDEDDDAEHCDDGDSGGDDGEGKEDQMTREKDREVQTLWEAVGKDPVRMARLANAVTFVRLEKKEREFM